MPIFLVETYLTLGTAHGRAERDRGAEQAADALTREGTTARFAGSIHIPADEICFFAFDTASSEDAELVAKRAGLDPLRVVHAVAPALGPTNQTHSGGCTGVAVTPPPIQSYDESQRAS